MSTTQEEIFPFLDSRDDEYVHTIKWQQGNNKYEIYIPILKELELSVLVPHCLSVKSKIDSAVSTEDHKGPSYFKVFPRTVSNVLLTIWNVIVTDDDPAQTINGFDETVRTFIASHATDEDRHELVNMLRSPRKPLKLSVQQFFYRLQELNSFVEWLPGSADKLTDVQLKQAFYDGMPEAWKSHFVDSGDTVESKTRAELSRYFRKQEKKSRRKMIENERKQKRQTQPKKPPHAASPSQNNKRSNSDRQVSFSNNGKCPVHPDKTHTWKECYNNPDNKNKKRRFNDDRKNSESSNSAVKKKSSYTASSSRKKSTTSKSVDEPAAQMRNLNIESSDSESD